MAALCSAATFGPEVRVSPVSSTNALTPRVAAVGGTVHAAWAELSASGTTAVIKYSRSVDSGDTWSASITVSTTTTRLDQTPVLVASATSVYLAWMDEVGSSGRLYFRRSMDAGVSWSEPEQVITNGTGFARPTSMLVDSVGRLHLVWYDSRNTPTVGQVFHRLSCDGGQTWFESIVSRYDYAVDNESPKIVELTDSSIHIAVRTTRAGDPQPGWPPYSIYMYRALSIACTRAPDSVTWQSPPQPVSSTMPESLANHFGIGLAPGASGSLYVSYLSDAAGVNLLARSGQPGLGAWSTAINLSESPVLTPEGDGSEAAGWGHGIASDSRGQPHAVFSVSSGISRFGFALERVSYRSSRTNGANWYGALPLVGGDYSRYASIASSGTTIYAVWSDWRDTFWRSSGGGAGIFFRRLDASGSPAFPATDVTPSTPVINFGAQLVGLVAVPRAVTLTNSAPAARTLAGMVVASPFASYGATSCAVAAGGSCQFAATFRTEVAGAITLRGTVEDTSGAVVPVTLTGRGTYSIADHYFNAILAREASVAELSYWDTTPSTLAPQGVDAVDVYVSMARFFLNSPEYVSRVRTNAQAVDDLYGGLFARIASNTERNYWIGELNAGLPRSAMKASFFTSPEFIALLRRYVTSQPSRLDVTLVVRLYRGFLERIPDVAGLQYWRNVIRQARCSNNYSTLQAQVRSVVHSFVFSAEYQALGRSNEEFTSDLYSTILGRGAARNEIVYWRDQLTIPPSLSRSQVVDMFVASTEFQQLIQGINAESCIP